jgi:hypothetical protein
MTWSYHRYEPFERELRETAQKWFQTRGYAVHPRYPFMLDDLQNWRKNIILPEVAEYVMKEMKAREQDGKGFPLHKYVHHGLSSQAMLFNLVGPMIVRGDLSPLEAAFRAKEIPWPTGKVDAVLEFEDRTVFNEDSAQPTSLDLVIKGDPGSASLFVECKFVEKEFGGCSVFKKGNCDGQNPATRPERCYLHFIGRTYWKLMVEDGIVEGPIAASPICPFANYYQFFREVLFAVHNGGTYVLLYDPRNPTFVTDGEDGQRGLYPFLTSMLPASVRARVKKVTVQDVLAAVRESDKHKDWAEQFAAKYGLSTELPEGQRICRKETSV